VLHHEQDVKQDGDEAQAELGKVPKDGIPVIVVVADEKHLDHREDAAREVQKDVPDAPAHRALTPEEKISRFIFRMREGKKERERKIDRKTQRGERERRGREGEEERERRRGGREKGESERERERRYGTGTAQRSHKIKNSLRTFIKKSRR
jgi:hypothetical protein